MFVLPAYAGGSIIRPYVSSSCVSHAHPPPLARARARALSASPPVHPFDLFDTHIMTCLLLGAFAPRSLGACATGAGQGGAACMLPG